VDTEPEVAFALADARPGIEVLVNFGPTVGRESTPAEIDEPASMLHPEVADVTIVSEVRHEIGHTTEAAVHMVRIEVDPELLRSSGDELDGLSAAIVETARFRARMCAADRPAPLL
jgi:hypothetical protein